MTNITLDRLYKTTKTGAIQICDISVSDDTFTVVWGQLDGKTQQKTTTCHGVNIGKSNETNGHQQALSEAKSKWTKKRKAGYSTSKEAPVDVQLPQKVKAYVGNESKIKFPAYSTIKLNGVNGIYRKLEDGSLSLTSRGGDLYPAIPHLEPIILKAMKDTGTDCLNGELYIHGEHLQDITSAVRKPKELSKKLDFRVFELPDVNKPYKDKIPLLKNCDTAICPILVNSHKDIEERYNYAMSYGNEGIVIYNADAVYKYNERSSSVYKYKKTIDAEFKIVSHELDKNNHAVYHCELGNGTFKVKRKGTAAERLQDAKNATTNYGKWLNVEYEMLSKDGVPLKPVGNGFRECNEKGEPIV